MAMTDKSTKIVRTFVLAVSLLALIILAGRSHWLTMGLAVSCVALVSGRWGRMLWGRWGRPKQAKPCASEVRPPVGPPRPAASGQATAEPRDLDEYVELLLAQGRHALLLRPQIAENLRPAQLERAIQAMHEDMAPVPPGQVLLAEPNLGGDENATDNGHGHLLTVHAYYIDRYPVTNRQFKRFVDSGGYEDSSLWEPSVWSGVSDFLDLSGQASPRFWQDRSYPESLSDHPVVGVSWYEAQAYARWAGKRLPSDPEWVKTGSWPVAIPAPRRSKGNIPGATRSTRTRPTCGRPGPGPPFPCSPVPRVAVSAVYTS